jgi:1-pyrroline-5-carboxylate dehydrogenase
MLRAIAREGSRIQFAKISTPTLGSFRLPTVENEPMYNYEPGSLHRQKLQLALKELRSELANGPSDVPCIVGGKQLFDGSIKTQVSPMDHSLEVCKYRHATPETIQQAIKNALEVKPMWEAMPFNDRAAIFLKAADLLTTKYRYKIMAATMIGQGKNAWQAEIDAAAELADFWRFNCTYAAEIYANQPTKNAPLNWNRLEYRALEGFVAAYSPFNFTAIGGNLAAAPALMGNVVLWKPSDTAILSNYIVYQILKEAGLPDGVIQFIPGDAEMVTEVTFNHPDFAGLHFTGSTTIFKKLWQKISGNLDVYKSYPRIVGETVYKFNSRAARTCILFTRVRISRTRHCRQSDRRLSTMARNARLAQESTYLILASKNSLRSWLPSTPKSSREMLMVLISDLDFTNHMSAVINKPSFDKITSFIDDVKNGKNSTTKILAGGNSSAEKGYFIDPTILVTKDPNSATMVNELFGPVVTIYVYPAEEYAETLELADQTTSYALTCGVFAQDREALIFAGDKLRNTAGNFYINDKCTGAVVGQQPFGGGRMSGTNDKAGSYLNLLRWVSPRTIKESFVPIEGFGYPSNLQ